MYYFYLIVGEIKVLHKVINDKEILSSYLSHPTQECIAFKQSLIQSKFIYKVFILAISYLRVRRCVS